MAIHHSSTPALQKLLSIVALLSLLLSGVAPSVSQAAPPDAPSLPQKLRSRPARGDSGPSRGPQAVDVTATKRDTLVGDEDHDGQADPGDTVRYTVVIHNAGDSEATGTVFSDTLDAHTTLSGTVRTTPLARPDGYAATGNVALDVPFASGVLTNDEDLDGGTVVVSDSSVTSTQGGTVSVAPDGSFTYDPPAGFEGSDTFTYTVTDDEGETDSTTVTVTVSDVLWFIDNSAAGAGDGRLSSPFNTLAAFEAINGAGGGTAPQAGDTIFLYTGSGAPYTGGLTLEDAQILVGEGAAQSLQTLSGVTPAPHSVPLPATGGSRPALANSTGRGITLAQNNALHGLNVGDTADYGLWGSGFGSLTVRDVDIAGSGPILSLNTGTLDAPFDTLSTSNAGSPAVDVNSAGGSLSAQGGTIAGVSAVAFRVRNGSATVTYDGAITQSSAASAIVVSGAGGSVDFNGPVTADTTTANAIDLTNNSGVVRFDGGLNATTSSGVALNATGGGTIHVTGSNNVLQSGTGAALHVQNTTIGADGLTFEAISAGGAASGIVLNDTGTAGGLTVTGAGSAGSGGTIQSGATCVSLQDTQDVSLAWMQINDCTDFAIRGTRVTGFALRDSIVDGSNGDDAAADEGSVSFTNLWGSAEIVRSTVSGGYEDNVRVVNDSGTLDRLSVLSATIGLNDATYGNDGLLVEVGGTTSVLNVTVDNTTFTGARGDMIQTNVLGSATMDLDFTDNTLHNTHPNVVSGGGGVTFSGGSATSAETFTYEIAGNSFRGALGAALLVYRGSGAGSYAGRITGNVIGASGVADSGSAQASGIWVQSHGSGSHDVLIENNQIYQYNEAGITLDARDGSSTLNATVTDNTVASPGTFALAGIWADVGALSTDTNLICADVQNNTVTGSAGGVGVADLYVNENQTGTTIRLPGYTGTAADTAAVESFLVGNNVGTPTASASGDNFLGGSACTQPSVGAAPGRPVARTPAPVTPGGTGPAKGLAAPVAAPRSTDASLNTTPRPWAAPTPARLRSGENIYVTIGALPAGKTLTLTFEVTIDDPLPAGVDRVANQGAVSGDAFTTVWTDDPDTGTAGDATATVVDAAPELRLAKDDGGVTARPGNTILYTLSYTNAGNQGASGVVLTETVPAHTTFDATASSPGWACTPDGTPGSVCTLIVGPLVSGGAGSATFAVVVADPAPAGLTQVENDARVGDDGANGADPDTANNRATDTTPVDAAPDLRLVKDDGGGAPQPGETLVYTLTYANAGDQGATGVTLTETVPAHTTFNATAGSPGWTCAPDGTPGSVCTLIVGPLAGGDAGSATFAVTVDDPLPAGVASLTNRACAHDDGTNGADLNGDDNCTQAATAVDAAPDLWVTKDDGGITVQLNETVRYTLTYTNAGNQGATGVVLIETVPAHTTFNATAGSPGWACAPDGNPGSVCTLPVGPLASGHTGSATFAVVVADTVPAGFDHVENDVVIDDDGANGADPNPGNNAAADTTPVDAAPELQLAKDDGGVTARPSNTILYTLSYTNAGPQGASGVVLTETVPAHTTFNATASSPGWACAPDGNPGSVCTLIVGPLASGGAGSATFAVVVADPAPAGLTQVENDARVGDDGANGADPDTANNRATDTTPVDAAPDLWLTKDDGGVEVLPGETLVYTLTYANAGDQDATGVVLTETVPAHTTFDATASAAGWTCAPGVGASSACTLTVGALGAGGGADSETFAVTVDDPLPSGATAIENHACILDDGANGADQNGGDNCAMDSTPFENRAPTLSGLTIDTPLAENDVATLSGQIYEPDASDSLTLTIDWGDGSAVETFPYTTGATTFSKTHRYLDDAPSATASDHYTVALTLVDSYAHVTRDSVVVTVNNLPPAVDAGADRTGILNQPVSFSGRFTDTGTLDTHAVTWDFGDGVTATGTLTPSHIYTAIDVYSVTLTVVDDDGGSTSDELLVDVNRAIVYVPLIMRNYVVAPDLIVEAIRVYSDQIQVVIKNIGRAPVGDRESAEFWVDLYVDPAPAPDAVNQPWPDLAEHGGVWGVTWSGSPYSPGDPARQALPLEPGEVFTLTTGGDYWWAAYSDLEWPLTAGSSIYIQVDSANFATDYGAIEESHEILNGPYNNITAQTVHDALLPGTLGPPEVLKHPISMDTLPARE